MVSREAIDEVLRTINDPEMPINIVDLGIVASVRIESTTPGEESKRTRVVIDILPTFVGCPALQVIEEEIRRQVSRLEGVAEVEVCARFDPPWSVDRISNAGREALRQVGITVPAGADRSQVPACPFCGSRSVRLESTFGPTRCRMIYYCKDCRHPFEHLKRVGT
jgi:ring-1,2-phenylacetyl-CoA epoxidase subunit PaaD